MGLGHLTPDQKNAIQSKIHGSKSSYMVPVVGSPVLVAGSPVAMVQQAPVVVGSPVGVAFGSPSPVPMMMPMSVSPGISVPLMTSPQPIMYQQQHSYPQVQPQGYPVQMQPSAPVYYQQPPVVSSSPYHQQPQQPSQPLHYQQQQSQPSYYQQQHAAQPPVYQQQQQAGGFPGKTYHNQQQHQQQSQFQNPQYPPRY